MRSRANTPPSHSAAEAGSDQERGEEVDRDGRCAGAGSVGGVRRWRASRRRHHRRWPPRRRPEPVIEAWICSGTVKVPAFEKVTLFELPAAIVPVSNDAAVGGRGVRRGVLVRPGDRVAHGDGQVGGVEGEVLDRHGLLRRQHAADDPEREHSAECDPADPARERSRHVPPPSDIRRSPHAGHPGTRGTPCSATVSAATLGAGRGPTDGGLAPPPPFVSSRAPNRQGARSPPLVGVARDTRAEWKTERAAKRPGVSSPSHGHRRSRHARPRPGTRARARVGLAPGDPRQPAGSRHARRPGRGRGARGDAPEAEHQEGLEAVGPRPRDPDDGSHDPRGEGHARQGPGAVRQGHPPEARRPHDPQRGGDLHLPVARSPRPRTRSRAAASMSPASRRPSPAASPSSRSSLPRRSSRSKRAPTRSTWSSTGAPS